MKTSLPKKWISKPMADPHKGDAKSNKLCIISPVKAKFIVLTSKNWSTRLPYFDTYKGGGYRYYSAGWGYEIAQRAEQIAGSPLCEVWANGKKYGVINPGFRYG